MTKPLIAPTTLPDWFRALPNNACVNANELAEIFRVTPRTIYNRNADHTLPNPEEARPSMAGSYRRLKQPQLMWKVGVIRQFIGDMRTEISE